MIRYLLIFLLYSYCTGQENNPCKNKRFLSLINIDLDDMSDRQYQYFIKKEEECTKYKAKRSQKKRRSNKNNKKLKKKNDLKNTVVETKSYTASIYSSLPLMRLNMVANFDKISINGLKIETPTSFNIGKYDAYLIFEFRNYNFSYFNNEGRNFGGNAFLIGAKIPFNLFRTDKGWFSPEFSILTGKFHFTKGLIFCLDIPQNSSNESPFKIKYSLRTNVVQTGPNNGTGWLDASIFLGYSL